MSRPNERPNEGRANKERLNEGAIIILRLLFRYGELSVSAISGLLGLYESRVEELCADLLKRRMINWKPAPEQDNHTPLRLAPKGRAYLIAEGHV
jgi:DNA-binding MarR family transcriptional regulator